ncbi:hypothetical protein [Sporosarcina sp. UB5]|uniref:hypothetical protein n=1 Tax=Sporosarcina sp. UB5 TaxID=3047463 RepID=UPI003D7BE236
MSSRKLGGIIFGAASLIVIGYTIYKIIMGKDVGFNEISSIAIVLMMFLSAITWGNKEDKDGILIDEELGQRITEKSSKISYFILVFLILVAVFVDELINGTVNIFLLGILGLSMIILPLVEFMMSRKYQ